MTNNVVPFGAKNDEPTDTQPPKEPRLFEVKTTDGEVHQIYGFIAMSPFFTAFSSDFESMDYRLVVPSGQLAWVKEVDETDA